MTRKVRTLAFRGMMQDRYERYRSLLRRAASKLSGKTDAPISTRHICAVLGVTVRRSRDQAKTTLARTASDEFEIVLPVRRQDTPYLDRFPRFSSDTESRERWWIAHEIGHVVLLQSRIPAPLGSEYWPFESVRRFRRSSACTRPGRARRGAGRLAEIGAWRNLRLDCVATSGRNISIQGGHTVGPSCLQNARVAK